MPIESYIFEIGEEVTVSASVDELSRIWVPSEANGKSGVVFKRETDANGYARYYIRSDDACLNDYYVLEGMLVPTSHPKINTNESNFDVLFN